MHDVVVVLRQSHTQLLPPNTTRQIVWEEENYSTTQTTTTSSRSQRPPWGCLVWVKNFVVNKSEPNSEAGVNLGENYRVKGKYTTLLLKNNRLRVTKDVMFNTSIFPCKHDDYSVSTL